MRRIVVPELLDHDRGTPQQIKDSLADLRMLNRWFGGTSTTVSLLRRVAQAGGLTELAYLDVAGASGDVADQSQRALSVHGIQLDSVVLDQAASHLVDATNAICGSAFQLPFRDRSFDVVGCSLFIHHLEPDDIVRFLKEPMRCARVAVIVNDLRRSRFHLAGAHLGRLIYRSPMTAHDAPVSVRRAYTTHELRCIIRDAGYPSAEFSHHYFYRIGVVIWRTDHS